MKTKTIIISSQNENSNARGILTIFSENGILNCRIRLYNINKISKLCKLGIYHESKVFSGNLIENEGVFTCSILGDFDIDKDFYSAIVDTSNHNEVVLSGGTYAGYYFNDDSVFNDLTYDAEPISLDELDSSETIEIHTCNDCEKCLNCEYKKYFFEHVNTPISSPSQPIEGSLAFKSTPQNTTISHTETVQHEPLITQPIETQLASSSAQDNDLKQPEDLFSSIIPQFQYVFENYEANTQLNNLIPNSKFVSMSESGENYSIGAIYAEDKIKFICYAVLKENSVNPPPELGDHYQWLPLDPEDPLSEGYFMVFQDAHDLKIVEI